MLFLFLIRAFVTIKVACVSSESLVNYCERFFSLCETSLRVIIPVGICNVVAAQTNCLFLLK